MMPPAVSVLTPMMERIAGVLLSSVWQAAVLAVGVTLLLLMVPRLTAAARYWAWVAVLGVSVMLPIAVAVLSHGSRLTGSSGSALRLDGRWALWLTAGWALLASYRGVQLAMSAVRLRTISRRAVPVAASLVPAELLTLRGQRRVELCVSADVERPSVIGFFAPRILVPATVLPRLSATELEHVVMHEMEHLRRGDDWVNLAQKLALVAFPLHPSLVWVERHLCRERELACDDGVLARTRAPKAYAGSLVRLAEHRLASRPMSLALGAWERRSELAQRVHHILARRAERMSSRQTAAAVLTLVVGLGGGSVELSRSPQLVSFESVPALSAVAANAPAEQRADRAAATMERVGYRGSASAASYQPAVFHSLAMNGNALRAGGVRKDSALPRTGMARRRVRTVRASGLHIVSAPAAKSWTVLTRWDDEPAPRIVRARQVVWTSAGMAEISTTYAAVRTDAGWLVLQL